MSELVASRYRIMDAVGHGGMGEVYRAYDRLTGEHVALKRVTVPHQDQRTTSMDSTTHFRLALAQEFRVLASLRHPNVISVLDYGFDIQPDGEPQPYYTMDLLPAARTILAYGREQPLKTQVNLLVQLFQALAYLHRRGIIHRDLKPDNVLVVDDLGFPVVKVLDFGLALGRQQIEDLDETDGVLAGTMAYLAPEIFQGTPASAASDLYAAGVIAYELFAGQHPFHAPDIGQLVQQVMTVDADCKTLDVSEELQALVQQLLAKDPQNRQPDPIDIIHTLQAVNGETDTAERAEIRESYLQAADFVGRDAELETLTNALNQVTAAATFLQIEGFDAPQTFPVVGSAWLVGGESGVGKSRLLEELRIQALVDGVLVLRGQAVGEGAAPYQLWRDALRRLIIQTELSDFEAGVLQVVVPDVAALLGRTIPKVPEIDSAAARNRLFTVIENLFKRQTQPVLVLLEDVHHATDSLGILSRLSRGVGKLALMIVASYRDDERPTLPQELPGIQHLKLERLPQSAIRELSTAMLGESGRNPQVVELIQRETEGNIFFIVEVVRALAEDSGDLANIGQRTLPEHVFTGGVNAVVLRRLDRVPKAAMRLLSLAAVAGRELDLTMLAQAAPEMRLESWLMQCTSVLEVLDNRWRFAHDKLREALLKSLDTDKLRAMHSTVATALEKVYGTDPVQASALAYHHAKAGNTAAEGRYAAIAGVFALKNSAYRSAIQQLSRALTLQAWQTPFEHAMLEDHLGRAYLALSQMTDSQHHFQQALQGFGYPMPQSKPGLLLSTLSQVGEQLAHRLLPGVLLGRKAQDRVALLKASSIYEQLGEIFYFANEAIPTAMTAIKSVNLAERADKVSADLAVGYAGMSVLMSVIPLHSQAAHYSRRAIEVARQMQDDTALGWACFLAGVYYTGVGEWEAAKQHLEEAVIVNERVGDLRRWETSISTNTVLHTYTGDYARSAALCALEAESALRREDFQSILWSYCQELQNWLVVGSRDQTPDALLKLEAMLPNSPTLAERIYGYGLAAWVHYRLGNKEKALQQAEMANRISAGVKPLSFYCVAGYGGAADTLLALWESSSTVGIREQAIRACKLLRGFAAIFPIGQARADRCDGLRLWLSGKPDQAHKYWQRSAVTAQKMRMPYDEALAYYEIGRHLPETDPNRQIYLQKAKAIFKQLGAAEALHYVDKLIR
jgi:tetratricopeptide (TPR) repeat protein